MEQFDQLLERDMAALEKELSVRQEARVAETTSGKEMLKQSLQAITGGKPAAAPAAQAAPSDEDSLLPNYVKAAPAETKLAVEKLLESTIHKGIVAATEEAKKSNPYILDAFHDALVEKLYPELQKRGLVK